MTPLPAAAPRASWLPMAIIAMGQAQMSLNVNALPVSRVLRRRCGRHLPGLALRVRARRPLRGADAGDEPAPRAGPEGPERVDRRRRHAAGRRGDRADQPRRFGLGQGALATLLFNVLVVYAPKGFADDVGSLRGTVRSLASGVGTALAGALAVGILAASVERSLADHPAIPAALVQQVDFDRASFVSNARLKDVMAGTSATPKQVEEAVRINADARLRALKLSFLLLAGIALLMISPAGRLPDYLRGGGGTGQVKGA